MTHWSILTFVMTFAFCHNVQGQVIHKQNSEIILAVMLT